MNRREPTSIDGTDRVRVFDELYDATFNQVLAYCRRRTWHLEDAEDAAVETYLIAWRKLDDAVDAESPLVWLYRVAFRVTANQRRSRDRYQRLTDRLGRLITPTVVAAPDDEVLTSADSEEVAAALEILSIIDREIVLLAAYEELSHTEIGQILALSPAATRTRLYRARRRLRQHLDEHSRRDIGEMPDTTKGDSPVEGRSGSSAFREDQT